MERQHCNLLQNFDEPKSEILKKRLLKATNTSASVNNSQNNSHNVLLNTLRAPSSNSMIVTSVQAPQSSMPITHNLVTHSIAPVKIHTNNTPYPLQLSTVHVPVQIPGSTSNINVPVQLSGATSSVPLQITPVSLPIQVSGTTNVPVQLPAGETINVPLQIPAANQNIQLAGQTLPSMPILQNTAQALHNSIIHLHMGSNPRPANLDAGSELQQNCNNQMQLQEASVHVKMSNPSTVSSAQISSNSAIVQLPNSSSNSIQLALPSSVNSGAVHLRGATRTVPHVVYIQTPTGLKPMTSTEVISQASTSGNPPQIIVRRPVTNNSNIHVISNVGSKPNIAPKLPAQKSGSVLAPANAAQPIVIQKPKGNEKVIVPVSIAPGSQGKQAIAYLSSVKKPNKSVTENQSILISSNQGSVNSNNQKLFITPMNIPKIQNTKFILPVTLPATMSTKGPVINLQIANGQIQNDHQGNITVMRDPSIDSSEMPPLQPLGKILSINGKDTSVPQSPKSDKGFTFSISGSRAEPTGEHGEYTLSIPETNASMNDDIYTVSIADDEGGQTREKSFTLAIPEKSKSLLNKNVIDRNDLVPATVAAPAILRRSNSDTGERKSSNSNIKRRISLCAENLNNKTFKMAAPLPPLSKLNEQGIEVSDDHRVPSLFCDEKLDKDKDSDNEEYKDKSAMKTSNTEDITYSAFKRDETTTEEDPPGLVWNKGVANLRGSQLNFQSNEFGLIEVVENNLQSSSLKSHTPLKQRIEKKKMASPEEFITCFSCGIHGMVAEFINECFCSKSCQTEHDKTMLKKRDKERADLAKKRNKMKKILMRKQNSDIDLICEKNDTSLAQSDSSPETQISEVLLMKMNEDSLENEKYPWMCGKNGFSWMRYLDVCKAKAAPVKLFKDPFPYNKNGFRVGMRLEAIDPQHQSQFCAVSVAEVQGHRMRLHFDEYPDLYDFWVNADSIDIFPVGWCERNGRCLKPPSGHSAATFSWPLYLKQVRAIAAPKQLFTHLNTNAVVKPHSFRVGMKMEAEDRHNDMVCAATIAEVMEGRLLVHYDSWDSVYDCWLDPANPYIHPVGWAQDNGHTLTPPNYYKDVDFSWETYLSDTMSIAAPPRAFKPRPPAGFKPGMKLEVVDKRVPFLIRVATISAVRGHQVRVSYDGWPDTLSHWLDDDSPDLHPVGWCLKTGHPLEPPLTAEEFRVSGPCGVGGCRGLGSVRGGAHKQHVAATACPYRNPEPVLPDRRSQSKSMKSSQSVTPTSDTPKEKPARGRPPKHKRVEEITKTEPVSDEESLSSSGGKRWRGPSAGPEKPPTPSPPSQPTAHLPTNAQPLPSTPRSLIAHHLSELALCPDPTTWTQKEVSDLVSRVAGAAAGTAAAAARLSGAELLMASCEELVHCLRLRLGPAVKVYAAVRHLRERLT